jgi:hemolysin activation/secretion protein
MEHTQSRLGAEVKRMQSGPSAGDPSQVVNEETPCFKLNTIRWEDAGEFSWINGVAAAFSGQCIGAQSLKRLRDYLTLHLIEQGYINSRVIYPEQNFSTGTLLIQVIAGRVGDVVEVGNPIGHRWFALATTAGQLVNQWDLDQTLENMRRLPSQGDMRIDLLPGKTLGETDLHIHHGTGPRYQGNVTLDNTGARNTGKNQLSANLGLDSPLGLNDALALYYNTNADRGNQSQGSRASGLQWSVPLGYASFALGINGSGYL